MNRVQQTAVDGEENVCKDSYGEGLCGSKRLN